MEELSSLEIRVVALEEAVEVLKKQVVALGAVPPPKNNG